MGERSHSISRRRFLGAVAATSVAAALAACETAVRTLAPSPSATASPTSSGSRTPSASAAASPSGPSSASPSSSEVSRSPSPTSSNTGGPAPLALRERIARLLVVGFRGLTLADAPALQRALDAGLGGVILFDRDQQTGGQRNVRSLAQVAALSAAIQRRGRGRQVIVAVDQEGGRVVRLPPPAGRPALASEQAIGAAAPSAVEAWAAQIAETLAAAGVNLDLAPVVDLDVNPANPAIGALGRSFSNDPAIVVRDATIEIMALHGREIRSAIKHFPGLGSATANTDFGVADVTATWRPVELTPFRSLTARRVPDIVMVGHVVNGKLDPHVPASLSKPIVTDLLRDELGWDGLTITDDLQAAAITARFGRDEAVARAFEAGNDLLLFANQQVYEPDVFDRAVDVIERLVRAGRIDEKRVDASIARLEAVFPA